MISDLAYTSKSLYASYQIMSKLTYLLGLEDIGLLTKRPLSF